MAKGSSAKGKQPRKAGPARRTPRDARRSARAARLRRAAELRMPGSREGGEGR